ncbi:MAG: SEL1-like repeat protein [Gammaproteobacteria bacterium]|nr:SEL1-like repeat protein [Gammaproteobacteria bacterium]NNF50395.1 SEL1-like repeat protein [Woeseiaceae bacterium]MBT8093691.1 SEL1-like repeat protein [Gammaproteobacteria bacterium]MBT8104737.1 SEL1-like repeat protein [Gammaproteobacteria bacterium]NNK24751.1 SEL1-like repeat protein [Woeseiaceae bacterium]
MAGYMFLEGRGVERDPVRASAWYRLAAESGAPEFIEVRDAVLDTLNGESLEASDAIYITLRQRYSDIVLALNLVRQERKALNQGTTGSRLGRTSSSVTIIDPQTGAAITRTEYERRLKSRIKLRLDYITDLIGTEELEADLSDAEFEALVDRVDEHLRVIADR